MTTTTNYGWTLVEANQTGKHLTVNAALAAIDADLAAVSTGGVTLAGDVTGMAATTVVAALQGIAVSTTDPTTDQVLKYNGTQWAPATLSAVTSVTLGGDVTGNSATATVAKLQGRTVASTSPTNGYVLTWNNGASQWEPAAAATTSSVTLTGDVSGSSGANTVDKLKGVAVSSTTPTTNQALVYNGTAWAPADRPFDIGTYIAGLTTASEVVMRYVFTRAVTFAAGLTASICKAGTAATASTTLTLAKNGSSFGTAVFAASGTTATFTAASSTSFAAGDILTITAPATPDTTLANVAITLAGTR